MSWYVRRGLVLAVLLSAGMAPGAELVGSWGFNEAAGNTVFDSTANAYHGNVVAHGTSPSRGPGYMHFEGGTFDQSRVVVPGMPSFSTYGSFSVVCGFRITSTWHGSQTLACKFGPSTSVDDEWQLEVVGPGNDLDKLHFGVFRAGDEVHVFSDDPISRDTWHTVTAVFRAGQSAELFLDGSPVGSETTTMTSSRTTSQPVWFGNLNYWQSDWNDLQGDIDYIRIYRGEVPEPATLSLLALGGLAMLRRRRR